MTGPVDDSDSALNTSNSQSPSPLTAITMADPADLQKQLDDLRQKYEEWVTSRFSVEDRLTDALERLLEKKIPAATRRPMPRQGSTEAPTLKKVNGREGKEFFAKFERCLREADIDDDSTAKEYLVEYLPEDIAKFLKTSKGWKTCTYKQAKETLMKALGDSKEAREYNIADLTALVRTQASTTPESLEDLKRRTISFNAIANYLLEKGSLTEELKAKVYLSSFHPEMKNKIVDQIRRKEPERDKDKAFSIELVYEAARYVVVPWFFEDEVGISTSIAPHIPTVERDEDKEEPKQYTPATSKPSESRDIDDLVEQLERMTIHDHAYAGIYNVVVRARPSMKRYLVPPLATTTSQPRQSWKERLANSANANQDQQASTTPKPDITGCFYCGEEGCHMKSCAVLAADLANKKVKFVNNMLRYHTGAPLKRAPGGMKQEVDSRWAVEKTIEKSKETRMAPPHQSNAFAMEDSELDVWETVCISIEDVSDSEDAMCQLGLVDFGGMQEEFETAYSDLTSKGIEPTMAKEVAWQVMVNKEESKIRNARQSSKPYDKTEKGKGKAKKVSFDEPEEEEPTIPGGGLIPPSLAKNPTVFPSSVPSTSRVNAPKPSDWPRSPASTPSKLDNGSKATTAPMEVDATPDHILEKRKAAFKYMSTVEKDYQPDKVLKKLLENMKLEIDFMDLLSLSLPLRKHMAEITKTRRMDTPTEAVAEGVKLSALAQTSPMYETMEIKIPRSMLTEIDRTPRWDASLLRVKAALGNYTGNGLMDNGSQINVMTEACWERSGLPMNTRRKIRMQGVTMNSIEAKGACENVPIEFGSVKTLAHFYVFEKGPYPFILGQPWIQDHVIANSDDGNRALLMIRDFHDPKRRVTVSLSHLVRPDGPPMDDEEEESNLVHALHEYTCPPSLFRYLADGNDFPDEAVIEELGEVEHMEIIEEVSCFKRQL